MPVDRFEAGDRVVVTAGEDDVYLGCTGTVTRVRFQGRDAWVRLDDFPADGDRYYPAGDPRHDEEFFHHTECDPLVEEADEVAGEGLVA